MIVRNEQQALCVAVEMEKRAIRVYERALMLAKDEEVLRGMREILRDEQEHLRRFDGMRSGCRMEAGEEQLLIQAVAAEMLFPGGVMEMERAQGLTTLNGLYAFAADSERRAVEQYTDFARRCDKAEIREAFLDIAREESSHLAALRQRLSAAEEAK